MPKTSRDVATTKQPTTSSRKDVALVGTPITSSELRRDLRQRFSKHVNVLEEVASGKPTEQMEVPLSFVAPLISCPTCKAPMKPVPGKESITVQVRGSARPGDRIKAVTDMGRLGISDKEVDVKDDPRVVAFVEKVQLVIKRNVGTSVYEAIMAELRVEVMND